MNPILYSPKEAQFDSFGLGVLSDCVSCTVTEERNGVFECEFQYPVSGLHFDLIQNDCLIKAKPNETKEPQLFRIYQISKPLNGIVTCKAEHVSYRLNSITVSPFTAGSAAETLVKLKANSAVENPFTFWTDLSTKAQMTVEVPSACRSLLGGTEGSFLDVYGGEFEWDNYTVKIHKKRGQDNGVVIEYGKNLTDLNQEEVISNLITGVHPYWRSTGTEEEPGELVELDGEKVITVRTDYSYPRIIPLDLSGEFEEKPTSQQLEEKAREYIEKSGILVPSVSLKVSFAPLWQSPEYEQYQLLERVSLCDEVTVRFPKLGVDAKAKVIKTTYDVLREKYTSIELGDAKSNFADTILDTMKEIEKVKVETGKFPAEWQQSIKNATDLLTGQKGGYIVLNTPDNPREIFVMDTPDMKTAKQVLRINLSGIGFSRTGINGPYYSAWTLDGAFVADWITAGTLTANIIRAGILSSLDGKSYWNLETGELVVSGKIENYGSNGKLGVRIQGPNIEIYNWALNGEMVGRLASVYASGKNYGAMALYSEAGSPVHIGVREKGGGLKSYITVADNDEGPINLWEQTIFNKGLFLNKGINGAAYLSNKKLVLGSDTGIVLGRNTGSIESGITTYQILELLSDRMKSYVNLDMNGHDVINSSDIRLKENIRDTQLDALSVIESLEFKEFDRMDTGQHKKVGLIAQQVAQVDSDLGYEGEDGIYRLDQTDLLYYALLAIKQLGDKLEEQREIRMGKDKYLDPYTREEKEEFLKKAQLTPILLKKEEKTNGNQ